MIQHGSTSVSYRRLMAGAHALARALPDAPAALNLCERRANFITGLVALMLRRQTCLLPPSRAGRVVEEVLGEHAQAYCLDDRMVEARAAPGLDEPCEFPPIEPDRVVVVGYTSGSTGRPSPNPKRWKTFVAATALNADGIRAVLGPSRGEARPWILATVPAQHMYGMELSVMQPLLQGMGVHGGHPLYPADVAAALAEIPEPRVLVTTPVHLRALVRAGISLPRVSAVVSATAPLARELAVEVEQRLDAPLLEFFGSTETCVIASRRTAQASAWTPYPGVALVPGDAGTRVDAPWFDGAVELQDVLEVGEDGRFVVRGRNADMVEVGGKRASLADLTRRVLAVPGVTDAIVFQHEAVEGAAVQRLAALVVAEGLSEDDILAAVAGSMDPVFLPRPIVRVPRLPRNDVGKLPRDSLLALLRR